MLHIKFQCHRSFGFRQEEFYMDMAAVVVMWHKPVVLAFIPLSHGGSTRNLASICLRVSKEKKFETVETEWPWMKVSEWPWPLIFITRHVLIWLTATGRGSSIGSVFAWHVSGPEFDPHVRHILSWRLGHENISTAIFPLPLIQEEQLSVTGERMCTKYW